MRFRKGKLLLLAFLCGGINVFAQYTIPDKPSLQTSVYDYTDLLPDAQEEALMQKLIGYSDSTSTQIVVVIIESTEGENINYLGAQWGQKWGIGQGDKDNGVLVLLASADRKIAINTGYGTEGSLTDALSKRIIEQVIIPEFKRGDYYTGLDRGADAIFAALKGEFRDDREGGNGKGFPLGAILPFVIFIVIIIILASRNKRNGGGRGGSRRAGPDIWDMIILSNMGRSSGSGGGFGSGSMGGGGFGGGFGGGGFGGGGASGGW